MIVRPLRKPYCKILWPRSNNKRWGRDIEWPSDHLVRVNYTQLLVEAVLVHYFNGHFELYWDYVRTSDGYDLTTIKSNLKTEHKKSYSNNKCTLQVHRVDKPVFCPMNLVVINKTRVISAPLTVENPSDFRRKKMVRNLDDNFIWLRDKRVNRFFHSYNTPATTDRPD